ncbi:hypothetical protein [Pseudomonas lactis]|uniref:hypothetical protein n=2 Tax=Gammaproteobacteria TaxID=1236 RepID=UPI00110C84FE|nr:hypothetical protein [Pseudomonas lactis]MBK3442936.1 hypothetical protein [Pseudomonas lactis]
MLTGIAHPRLRRDVCVEETTQACHPPQISPSAQTPSAPEVEAIAPASAIRSDLIKGLQITDQRLLLNQYQALNQDIQALLLRQPTLSSVIEQQLARSLGITPPVDVSSLYVHRYHTDEQGQRTLVSVEGITEALFKALRQLKTSPDVQPSTSTVGMEVGFYRSDSPSESTQQLQTRDTLLSIAQTIEKQLPLSLARFWTEPRTGEPNPESPQNELLAIHREMLSTLAALGVEDGALTPAAKSLIDKAFEYPSLEARERAMKDGERPGVYPLKLEVPRPAGSLLAGAFLITSSDGSSATRPFNSANTDRTLLPGQQQGLTVLYTPRDGYETFDSPAKALAALRQRINDDPDAAQQLLQSLPTEVQQSLKDDWQTHLSQNLSPVKVDVIAAGVPQLLERQRQQVSNELQALYDSQSQEPILVDPWRHLLTERGLHEAADLGWHFDGDNALLTRTQWLDSRSHNQDARQALDQSLGNQKNWQYLAQTLNESVQTLPEKPTARDVSAMLKKTPMNIAPDSGHYQSYIRAPGMSVSVEAFLTENGLPLPKTLDDLLALAQTANVRAQQHPLGNFAGALSWPLPLSVENQRELFNVVACNSAGLEGLPLQNPSWGALDYLASAVSLSPTDMQEPAKALEKLLGSPRYKALGEAIQNKINGIATHSSINDYVLAAIHLGLDHESIDHPSRSRVAGFDLAADTFWNKPPSDIISALAEHLSTNGKTSTQTAALGARLLLGRVAPQFLVKDIPATVTVGSMAWANLCLAVARIEAQTPGKVAWMSFGEVMLAAEDTPPASEAVQKAVLMDWAVANQITHVDPSGDYTQENIEYARTVFNRQLDALKVMSERLETPMPNRRAMALALLKDKFGDDIDFEQKCLRINYGPESIGPRFGPAHSLLDLTMEGMKLDEYWQRTDGATISKQTFDDFVALTRDKAQYNVVSEFNKKFTEVTDLYKDIKKDLVMNAITHLPLEDRTQLNYGKIRFFKENSYRVSYIPFVGENLFHSSATIRVQTELNGKKQSYLFDTEKGTIQKTGSHPADHKPVTFSDEVIRVEEYSPNPANTSFEQEKPLYHGSNQNHFQNHRIQEVAETVVKGLGIDSDAVRRLAEGRTAREQQRDTLTTIGEFLLDLIPLRSAIANFRNGNIKDGAIDLAFDLFGFLTAGVAMVGKLAKAAGKTGNAVAKVARSGRIIGATAFSAFNPLGGLGDVAVGAAKVLMEGASAARTGVQRMRGMATGGELVKASKRYEAAATGLFKVGEQQVQGSAIKHNGKWYAYDAMTQKPYGAAREFSPADLLMPPSPNLHDTTTSSRNGVRHNPLNRASRPSKAVKRVPLPEDEYATSRSTNGYLVLDHFTPNRIKQTREKFVLEKNGYLQDAAKGERPRAATVPDIENALTPNQTFEKALENTDVLVLGEDHTEVAGLIALRDGMKTFHEKGVSAIYLEGTTLDPYGLLDDRSFRHALKRRPGGERIYEELITEAEKYAIELLPLEHKFLTRHSDTPGYFEGLGKLDKNSPEYLALSKQRLEEVNYYGARQIMKNELGGKSVVLVGRSHMNTAEGVYGIAELTGGIGIGVYQKSDIAHSGGRKAGATRDTSVRISGRDDTVGDLQIDIKA